MHARLCQLCHNIISSLQQKGGKTVSPFLIGFGSKIHGELTPPSTHARELINLL